MSDAERPETLGLGGPEAREPRTTMAIPRTVAEGPESRFVFRFDRRRGWVQPSGFIDGAILRDVVVGERAAAGGIVLAPEEPSEVRFAVGDPESRRLALRHLDEWSALNRVPLTVLAETVPLRPFPGRWDEWVETERPVAGQDVEGVETSGVASVWRVTGPEGLKVLVRVAKWDSGARDVALTDRLEAPKRFDRLASGLRLGVTDGRLELRQARLKANDWSNLFAATPEQLAEGAGVDVLAALREAGARAVGTREELWADDSRRRRFLAAECSVDDELVPVVAYVLTRVAPLHRGITA